MLLNLFTSTVPFCLAQAFILLFSHLCAACILLLSMSEGGSSEASASDTKSVTLGVDDLRKLIKETVCEELTTEKSSVSSILKSRSKDSFNYAEVSASMPSPEHQYCYIIWYIWPNFNMAKTRGPSCHSGHGAAVVVWIRSAWMARGGCYSQQVSPESCELLPTQATSCSPSGLPLSRPLIGQPFLAPTAVLFYSLLNALGPCILLLLIAFLLNVPCLQSWFHVRFFFSSLCLNPSLLQFFPSFPFFYLYSLS